jgi:hypothetical protein
MTSAVIDLPRQLSEYAEPTLWQRQPSLGLSWRARKVAEAEGIVEQFMTALKITEDSAPVERGNEYKD